MSLRFVSADGGERFPQNAYRTDRTSWAAIPPGQHSPFPSEQLNTKAGANVSSGILPGVLKKKTAGSTSNRRNTHLFLVELDGIEPTTS